MAVAFDASNGTSVFSVTSVTVSVAGGTPTAVGFALMRPDTLTPTAVTYAGVALTKKIGSAANDNQMTDIWGLVNPAAGTQNAVVSWSGSNGCCLVAMTVTGSDTTTCFTGTGTRTSGFDVTVATTADGELCIGGMVATGTPTVSGDGHVSLGTGFSGSSLTIVSR